MHWLIDCLAFFFDQSYLKSKQLQTEKQKPTQRKKIVGLIQKNYYNLLMNQKYQYYEAELLDEEAEAEAETEDSNL